MKKYKIGDAILVRYSYDQEKVAMITGTRYSQWGTLIVEACISGIEGKTFTLTDYTIVRKIE